MIMTNKNITVLVTGGAGFIGSHLCTRLIDSGYNVICLDNLSTGSLSNIAHLVKRTPQFYFQRADVEYLPRLYLETVAQNVDAVIHLASLASPVAYMTYPLETLSVGSLGTRATLNFAYKHQARYLLASTSEVYGDPLVHPQSEEYNGNVNPIGVRSVYDESKRFAESITTTYMRYHGLDIRIARIFNTYGTHMQVNDGRVISNFINQAITGEPITVYGDGTQTRSFCYVSDTVDALMRLLNKESSDLPPEIRLSDPINIGNPIEQQIIEIANTVKTITNSNSPIQYKPLPSDDPKKRQPDITKAKKILEWEPRVSLEEGIVRTYQYFKDL